MLSTPIFLLLQSILLFLLGCSIGSFLNVLIERLPREESVVKGRSHCDSCQYMLAWYDLFPLFSYIFLNGTCRYCHKKIGSQTFIIEAFTGILFAVTGYSLFTHMTSPLFFLLSLVYVLFIFCCFIAIAVIDTKHGIIPNTLVYSGLLLSLIYHIFSVQTFLSYLFSALGAGGFFFFLFAVTKGRGMGFGDVKLALLLGLFLGFPNIVIALYVAFLTGAVIAFILVLEKKKKFSGSTIPFGPFLILGAFIAFFYGDFLWNHILSSFL